MAIRSRDPKERTDLIQQSEAQFRSCMDMAPVDGRAYVGVGRILVDQRRFGEAVKLYEEGTRLTGAVLLATKVVLLQHGQGLRGRHTLAAQTKGI